MIAQRQSHRALELLYFAILSADGRRTPIWDESLIGDAKAFCSNHSSRCSPLDLKGRGQIQNRLYLRVWPSDLAQWRTVEGGLLGNFKGTLVRPQELIAETQPQLHPVLLSLSAIISQYFTR